MPSIAYPKPQPIPVPVSHRCPAGCGLIETLRCWLGRRRELLVDLAAAGGRPDAEVLAPGLRAAERRIDALIALGRWAA